MMDNGYSLSDIAAVSGSCRNNDGMFGGDWSAWIILFLLFGLFGGNGWGGGFGGGSTGAAYTDSAIQRGFDNQSVMNKLNGLENGLCDGFYAVNTSLLQGFNGVNTAICNLGYQTQAGFNGLSSQLAQCCCDTQRSIDNVRYDLATQACDTRNTIQNSTRDILESNNANTRAILDFLVQSKLDAKDEKIAEQAQTIQALNLNASQANQNAVIRAAIDASTAEIIRRNGNDYPVNAVVVQPSTPVTFPVNGCGNFCGYGCNNGCNNGCGGF